MRACFVFCLCTQRHGNSVKSRLFLLFFPRRILQRSYTPSAASVSKRQTRERRNEHNLFCYSRLSVSEISVIVLNLGGGFIVLSPSPRPHLPFQTSVLFFPSPLIASACVLALPSPLSSGVANGSVLVKSIKTKQTKSTDREGRTI